jgi:hypothetical protein
MRILWMIGIPFIAVLVAVASMGGTPTTVKEHDAVAVSVDPANLTATKLNLPTEQYDAF